METLIGDVLLSSAFLAYAGYFDQQLRDTLFGTWTSHLQAVCSCGGGPAAKISATLFSADEIFEIFGKICSIMVEIFEIFVVNWHIFFRQYSVFHHTFKPKTRPYY